MISLKTRVVVLPGLTTFTDPDGVLVVDDAQFEVVPCLDASGVVCYGCSVCVHLLAKHGVWSVFGWLWQVELIIIGN